MTRTATRLALGLVGVIIALNVLVGVAGALTGGTPGGPRSSSYATGTDGLAAYESLLSRTGHPIARERRAADEAALDPRLTAVLLDPSFVGATEVAALRRFVRDGGRLLAGGASTRWIEQVLDGGSLGFEPARIAEPHVLAPAAELAGVRSLALSAGAFTSPGRALPVFGDANGAAVAVADVGRGRVVLFADTGLLHNERLAQRDNARLGVAAAGPPSRPVIFLESYHGYRPAEGLGALPDRWWAALGGLLAAGLVYLWARFRRLGPPERESRELPPARLEYVDAVADLLGRGKAESTAATLLRERAGRHLERRLGPTPDGLTPERLARYGLDARRAVALTDPTANLLDVARAAAAAERRARRLE